jgi:ATP-binding cassette subfamily B protein
VRSSPEKSAVAVLATIGRHHGLDAPFDKIEELVGTATQSPSLGDVLRAAEGIGLVASAARLTIPALARCPGPLIAHLRGDASGPERFVCVFEVSPREVTLGDPIYGRQTIARGEFERAWTGDAIVVAPASRLRKIGGKGVASTDLLVLLSGNWGLIVEASVAGLLATGLSLVVGFYTKFLVDGAAAGGTERVIHAVSIGAILIVLLRVGLDYVKNQLTLSISQRIDMHLSMEFYQHILRLPLGFFESHKTGDILSRLADTATIRNVIGQRLLAVAVDGLFLLPASAAMLIADWRLALVVIGTVPLQALGFQVVRGLARTEARKSAEARANLQAHLVEVISGAAAVKAARAEGRMRREADLRLVQSMQSQKRLSWYESIVQAVSLFLNNMSTIAVLWLGAILVARNQTSLGQVLLFQTLLQRVLTPMQNLASFYVDLQGALLAATRVGEILACQPEDTHGRERTRLPHLRGHIVFENVRFRYDRDWILDGVDLEIPAGKTVALVGRSGSGKTTITKLMARFYDPVEGRILVDGHDLRDLDLPWYRSQLGIVDQECVIFSCSVKDNIRLGRGEATHDDVVRAATSAGASEFIEKMPDRYETKVGERGSKLSGGQRQRLAIARALVGDPPIMTLDEATSHLDSETERGVQKTFTTVARGRTTIVVAHRLSTVVHADRIYVMGPGGRVLEVGTHDELLARNGVYADMWLEQVPASMLKNQDGAPALDPALLKSGVITLERGRIEGQEEPDKLLLSTQEGGAVVGVTGEADSPPKKR